MTERDFCARVKRPSVRTYTEDDPNCLTAEQLDRLAQAIPAPWYPLFVTMAFTGLRFGEASALMWTDIDYERGLIHIRRNNWKGRITEPKTARSRRTVPMVPELAAILRQHRGRMLTDQHPGLARGHVFPSQNGTLHKGVPLGPVIRKALAQAGINIHLTTHGLRRTFNDLARRVATGQVVRAIVGHTTEAMTEHYSMIDASEKHAVQAAVIQLVSQHQ